MHFSFSPERYGESSKYREDIKHDVLLIEDTYKKDGKDGIFRLTHDMVAGKSNGMKLMSFDFSYSSGIQYLMNLRNVRNEMIRTLQTESTPQAKEIISELNNDIVNKRTEDISFYSGLSDKDKARTGGSVDLRENYQNLLNEYPSERSMDSDRVPINIEEDLSSNVYSPFIEMDGTYKNLDRSRDR